MSDIDNIKETKVFSVHVYSVLTLWKHTSSFLWEFPV